jgi:anhydro-N-acetylmuramic acid kinase
MSAKKSLESELYIGLMSGTSIDGVDVALVKFEGARCELVNAYLHPISDDIRTKLFDIATPRIAGQMQASENRIELLADLDVVMGHLFADAVNCALKEFNLQPERVKAIGSHGQTIRHRAEYLRPFTLQIGDPSIIAENTQIKTIADFRRMDIAAGGQGAPLAPAFHNAVLRSERQSRIILNLGGIANITVLDKDQNAEVTGFDTGPANALLDAWFCLHHKETKCRFDRNAEFALQGKVQKVLLDLLLSDPYFSLAAPKSSGKEYFNLDWLQQYLTRLEETYSAEDIQSTLLQLTVITITEAIHSASKQLSDYHSLSVLSCGGGMHNHPLLDLLQQQLNQKNSHIKVGKTNDVGIDGDYLEAMTFAWLAKQRVDKRSGNLPSVTGARRAKILGAEYLP